MYMSTQNKKARPAQCTSKSSSVLDLQSENNACHTRISISLLEACFETALLRWSGEEWWKCSQTLSTALMHNCTSHLLPPSASHLFSFTPSQGRKMGGWETGFGHAGSQKIKGRSVQKSSQPFLILFLTHSHLGRNEQASDDVRQ